MIGRVLNHSEPSATAVYARLDLEPVRRALEANAQAMLEWSEARRQTSSRICRELLTKGVRQPISANPRRNAAADPCERTASLPRQLATGQPESKCFEQDEGRNAENAGCAIPRFDRRHQDLQFLASFAPNARLLHYFRAR